MKKVSKKSKKIPLADQIFKTPPPKPAPEKPDDLKDIKNVLNFLNKAYDGIAKYVEGERNRTLTMQTFIGEAVTYELLHQSYGIPEYTNDEKLTRLLSCITKAIDKYYEAKDNHSKFGPQTLDDLWARPDDPHNIGIFEPDPSTIRIREIPVKRPFWVPSESKIETESKKDKPQFPAGKKSK